MDDATVWSLVADRAAQRSTEPALTGGGRTWTYAELVDDVEKITGGLRASGVNPGDVVAIYSSNNPEMVLTWLACARSGIVASAINFMFVGRELTWVLDQLQPAMLVVDHEHLAIAREALTSAGLDVPVALIGEPAENTLPWSSLRDTGRDAGPAPSSDDVIEITYTSGTTGNPKGAVFTNAAHAYALRTWNDHFGIDEQTVTYAVTPLFHASGMRNQVLSALIAGGHVHVIDRFRPATFWQEICELGINFFMFVETIMLILEKQEPSHWEREHRVRRAVGPGQPDLLRRIKERFGIDTLQIYGMTEVSIVTAQSPSMSADELEARRALHPDANYVGEPIGTDTHVRLVDDDGNDVPEGALGEFWIKSRGQLREYFRDPEGTAATIVDGWVHSGDYGIRGPGGALYFVDRKKDMIRRSGENIAPKEIEDVLIAHDGVLEATVIPVPDPVRVQEVKAIIVRRPDRPPVTPDEIWGYCDRLLARYKVPRYVEFRDQLPRNSTGRVLKARLREEPIEGLGDTYDRLADGARVEAGPRS